MDQLREKDILILGLGLSGLAMARWCSRWGARVTVSDTRPAPPQLDALRREVPSAKFVCAQPDPSSLLAGPVDAVFRSPGLAIGQIDGVLKAAQARGAQTGGELNLFWQALEWLRAAQEYRPKVLAVTGTNGKTTVTSLTGKLVERAGKTVMTAGNIGPTLLDSLTNCLDARELPDVWVLELSSFQLDGVESFEPTAASVLNVTQDHLDWHGSMENYVAAKRRIFGTQTIRVLNRQDPVVMSMWPDSAGKRQAQAPGSSVVTFGPDLPARPGDFGLETVNGMCWLVRAMDEESLSRKKSRPETIHLQRLMPAEALRIRGRHNALNALAALALATSAGCALAPMLYGLRDYQGEPHRVESVGIIGDVEYFDDSKGTNVGATVAALNGLGADRRLVVILGGEGKGQDFSPLLAPVQASARAIVVIGRDGPSIQQVLDTAGVPIVRSETMADAVARASELAQVGDAVLMSPACASFDMFDNYEHRAQVFRDAVADLARADGFSGGDVL